MTLTTGDNKFGVAKWIVDPTAGLGTHTTIQSAINSASSGEDIFIRPGTYTENLTLKSGINLVAFNEDEVIPNVTVIGKCSFNESGTTTISNIRLQTNGDALLEVTGANASILSLEECYIDVTNATGINYTNSNANSILNLKNCTGNAAVATAYFASSSSGLLIFQLGNFGGDSSTTSTISAGTVQFLRTNFSAPVTSSGTSRYLAFSSQLGNTSNVTNITIGGSGLNQIQLSDFRSGTATAIVVDSNLNLISCNIFSSNTSAISGSGTLNYSGLNFLSSSSNITVTTQTIFNEGPSKTIGSSNSGSTNTLTITNSSNTASSSARTITAVAGTTAQDPHNIVAVGSTRAYSLGIDNSDSQRFKITTAAAATVDPSSGTTVLTSDGTNIWVTGISFNSGTNVLSNYTEGTWTPTITGVTTAGTTTYTSQNGYYVRVGNMVTVWGNIVITAATGTGSARIDGLPFTIKNQSNYLPEGPIVLSSAAWAWPVSTTSLAIQGNLNTTNALIAAFGSTITATAVQMTNGAATFTFTLSYQI